CDRTIHANESVPSHVRSHDRRPEGIYATLEDEVSTLSSRQCECPVDGFQLRGICGGHAVLAAEQQQTTRWPDRPRPAGSLTRNGNACTVLLGGKSDEERIRRLVRRVLPPRRGSRIGPPRLCRVVRCGQAG